MKRFFGVVNILLVIAAGAAVASAQDMPPQGSGGPPPGGGGMRFQMPSFSDMDKNKDKKLARDEFPSQIPSQVFDRLDENKDGFVDEEEWGRGRSRMGGGGQRFGEALTKFMDSNADAKVSREEFAKITQIFDALDKDKSGDLSQEELGRFFQAVGEVQAQATGGVEVNNLFEKYDKNRDGKITAEELGNERTFSALDLSKDGSVTREEAEQALKQLASRSRQQKQ